jgi:hypothetical protein
MTGNELASVLAGAAKKALAINQETNGPLVRLRLSPDGIVAHISYRHLHFTRTTKYETLLASKYSSGMLETDITNAVAEIRKAA